MEKQISFLEKVKGHSDQVSKTAVLIRKKSEDIGLMETDNLKTLQSSYENLEILNDKIRQTADSYINTTEKVKELEEKGSLIQSITDEVSKISRNTHLLALNASIEAARAGEAGKGFSVIAQSISKLATDSALQAKRIEDIIKDVRSDISTISERTESEVEEIKQYLKISEITKSNLSELKQKTDSSYHAFAEIGENIAGQVENIDKIDADIGQVFSTFENTSLATAEIAVASEKQNEITENTYDRMKKLQAMNLETKQYINSFVKNYKINEEKQKYIRNGIETLKEIAGLPALGTMEYSKATPALLEQLKKYPYFELFGLVQKDGLRKAVTLNYTEQEVYTSFAHRPYFKQSIAGRDYISEPYISTDTNNYCIAISVPVKNADGEIIGILIADLKL
jgi:methyl-accepting chemotaxis protein